MKVGSFQLINAGSCAAPKDLQGQGQGRWLRLETVRQQDWLWFSSITVHYLAKSLGTC